MPIYLTDLLEDPGILLRGTKGRKSRAELREKAEDAMYEELSRLVEEHPIGATARLPHSRQ